MTAQPLSERRLPEVTAHIEADYTKLVQGIDLSQNPVKGSYAYGFKRGYDYKGTYERYEWQKLQLDSHALLEEDGLNVLDLGCGAGRVVREYNARSPHTNKAYGITANTYGEIDPAVLVGNVHYLDDIYPADLGPVDLAMSRLMYMHLADPPSVLTMMAGHIKRGGLMVVDGFSIRAKIGSLLSARVIRYLVQSGHFEITGNNAAEIQRDYIDLPDRFTKNASTIIPSMLLRRTSEPDTSIDLPITYGIHEHTGRWQYISE